MTNDLTPVRCGCGGEAMIDCYLGDLDKNDLYYVFCPECNIQTANYFIEAEAITAWNRAMGAENICENCKEYIFDETYEGWCRCDDEYPTPRKYGCNCFERKGES